MIAYTDYPVVGTCNNCISKIHIVTVFSYDGNKYCNIVHNTLKQEIKLGYLFKDKDLLTQLKSNDIKNE